MTKTVVIRYVGPKTKKFEVVTQLGNGKPHRVVWDDKNDYTVELPVPLTFIDPFRKKETVQVDNFPLFLLNSYGPKSKHKLLKFVEEHESPDFEKDPLDDFRKEAAPESGEVPVEEGEKKTRGQKKKEKQNETQ